MKSKQDNLAVVITGAGRGLGRALALHWARQGGQLLLVARDAAQLEQVAAEVAQAGGRAWVLAVDVAQPGSAQLIAQTAHAVLGGVDVLVLNASTLGPVPMPLLADLSPDDVARVVAVNLLAPWQLLHALGGAMALRNPAATVVTLSSDAAVNAYPSWGAYSVTKAALDQLVRNWAAESPLRIIAVDPGEMATQMHAAALPDADPATLADPAIVAAAVAAMVADPNAAPSGSRQLAQAWGHTDCTSASPRAGTETRPYPDRITGKGVQS